MLARSAMNPPAAFHECTAGREIMDLERGTTSGRFPTLSTHDITLECISMPALPDPMATHVSMDLACESTVLRGFTSVPYVSMV